MVNALSVILDGFSYGALLFLMSVGLSVTLGLMGFVNLAHTAIVMLGGYLLVTCTEMLGLPFIPGVLLAMIGAGLFGAVLERGLFRFVYRAPALDQVLLTVGVMLMIGAAITFLWGPGLQAAHLPSWLDGRVGVGALGMSRYRLFLLATGILVLLALLLGIERTRFGAMIRASVDDQDVSEGLGIPVDRVFMTCFAIGSALAALGGALGVQATSLDPGFATRYLVLALLVVVVGGAGSITGTFAASMLLGVAVVAGAYYLPDLGSFVIYAVMILVLSVRPQGMRRA
jgi:branched-chain amino acid transport system permease protein